MAPKGPYKLCTVNKVPARAKILIGRVVEDVKEEYTIVYAANSESMALDFASRITSPYIANERSGIEEVKAMCEKEMPDVLVCSLSHVPTKLCGRGHLLYLNTLVAYSSRLRSDMLNTSSNS
jgi:hypothetical protein